MPGHSGIYHCSEASSTYSSSSDKAWYDVDCGHCGRAVRAAVLASSDSAPGGGIAWARCTACGEGIIIDGLGRVLPPPKPGRAVAGLPEGIEAVYSEARACMGLGAHTAVEMLCRKLLTHVANERGAATVESFAAAISYLEAEGYVTPPMKPWVDRIRQRGNIANHELPNSTARQAQSTLDLTGMLLEAVYGAAHLAASHIEDA